MTEEFDLVHGERVPRLGTAAYEEWENRPEAVASRRAYGPPVYGRAYEEASRRAGREGGRPLSLLKFQALDEPPEGSDDSAPAPGASNREPWPVQTLADVRARDPIPQPEIIRGLLRKRGILVLTGLEGSGKSLLLQDLAARVALGEPWLGIPTTRSRVGLLTLELEDADATDRSDLLGLDPDSERGIRILTLDSLGTAHLDISSDKGPDLKQLCRWAKGLDLVILDPKANLYWGAEDREGHLRLLRALDRLRFLTGAGIATGSHVPKVSPKEAVHTARGDTSFTAEAQAVLALMMKRKVWAVVPAKVRIGPRLKPIYLATTETGGLVLPLAVQEAPAGQAEGKESNVAALLEFVPRTFTAPGKIQKAFPIKVSRSTFNAYLAELLDAGDIEDNGRDGRARKYRRIFRAGESEDYPEDSGELLEVQ